MKEYSADSGAVLPEVDSACSVPNSASLPVIFSPGVRGVVVDDSGDQFAHLPLKALVSSLTNPRKNFSVDKLTELADSIKASGVHQPILVRPLPGSRVRETSREAHRGQKWQGYVVPTHEIVSGERRYRASLLAGVATIPALIRPLTDDQVLEIQIVENLQRDDLTELEEAEGYEALMQHNKINADDVGTKIGKSRSYVYARLKLLDLCHECKVALREGTIDASRALLIARIPDSKLQLKALEEATRTDYKGDTPTTRMFQTWLRANVMLRLDAASFKITDSRLVASAGSCKDCPKRTGANPDLFADVDSADTCTDPACYHSKEDAHRETLRRMAEKKGMRIIEGAEAEELLLGRNTNRVEGYTSLGQVRNDITVGGQTGATLRELLGTDAPAPVLFEHPHTKELLELVPTDEAEGVLLAKGLLKAEPAEKAMTPKQLEAELKTLQDRFQRRQQCATDSALMQATIQAVRDTDDTLATALLGSTFLRAWLILKLDQVANADMAAALGYTFEEGQDEMDALTLYIRSCGHANLCRAAVICLLHDEDESTYDDNVRPVRDCLTSTLAVPIKAVTAKAIKAAKAEFAEPIKALQQKIEAQPQPTAPTPTPPLAAPTGGAAKSKLKKTRLSPDEAQSGIAVAMQGIEAGPVPGPETTQSDQAVPVLKAGQQGVSDFALGQKVRVTSDTDKLGLVALKHAGKQGTITGREPGGGYWDVTFKGRSGGVATFTEDQLELVPAQ